MALPDYLEEACDYIDAGMFTGDSFYDKEAIERLEYYMARWQREIILKKAFAGDIFDNEKDCRKSLEDSEKNDVDSSDYDDSMGSLMLH